VVVMELRLAGDVGVLTGRQVDALHDAELHEQVEGPEDRRPANARLARPRVGHERGRREMATAALHRRRDGPAWLGQAVPSLVKRPENVRRHHVMILSLSRPRQPIMVRLGHHELLLEHLPDLPRVRAIVGDRAYRGLAKLAERKHLALDVKAPPPGTSGFVPIRPLYKIEHAFAQLGRWRRLSRCDEGTEASARAWLEVASVGYLVWRAVA
jgi:hypothetical protein